MNILSSSSSQDEYIEKKERARKIYWDVVGENTDNFLERFIWKILWLSDNTCTESDVMYSDWEYENDTKIYWSTSTQNLSSLDKNFVKRSALLLKHFKNSSWVLLGEWIKWLIDDKEVHISYNYRGKDNSIKYFNWTIDWQEISREDAWRIFTKYYNIAKERTNRIDNIRDEKVKIWIRKRTSEAVESILIYKK